MSEKEGTYKYVYLNNINILKSQYFLDILFLLLYRFFRMDDKLRIILNCICVALLSFMIGVLIINTVIRSKDYFARNNAPFLIVDDVLTTGRSMKEMYKWCKKNTSEGKLFGVKGIVLFTRGKCPRWVTPVFQLEI